MWHAGVQYLDEEEVHVDGFDQHPWQRRQQEEMDEEADDHAPGGRVAAVDSDDEHKVETEESKAQVDQDSLRLLGA